jgi:signal transduction histidine kinase
MTDKSNFRILFYHSLFYLLSTFTTNVRGEEKSIVVTNEKEQVIIHVKKAKDYIEAVGKEKAIAEFNKKSGKFSKDSSYIFAVAYDGIYLATINYPHLVGTNQLTLNNPYHVFLVKEEIEKAKSGGGWLTGRLKKNPHTGKHECKQSYILPMPGDYFIGSGYYYPADQEGNCQ